MVFPFGKTIAPPLTPLLSPPHAAARPQRCPSAAPPRGSSITLLMTLIMSNFFGAEPAQPQAAAGLPEEVPITSPQDLNVVILNHMNELTTRGVPPGGEEDGKKEDQETLTWLTGGDGGTVAAHAVPDDPQTRDKAEDNPKSGESAVPTPMKPTGQGSVDSGTVGASQDGGGDGGTVASQAAPITALPPSPCWTTPRQQRQMKITQSLERVPC